MSVMHRKYPERKSLNLADIAKEREEKWANENIFQKTIDSRKDAPNFVFYEGPPSANGLPGIHHVMARAIKDVFCRYKTLKGFQVNRKAGWDTHGLPVELSVEKELGITKEDIGKKISVEEYNEACKNAVMRYTQIWNDLTQKMGYWVDIENPYITYESKYMESVWWLLSKLYNDNLIYKGYTIQPYSPKAGTGLSSHELNQPGCYKDVTDTTVVAQFKLKANKKSNALEKIISKNDCSNLYFLAWTTTPWTLPSNTALTVGPKIDYSIVKTHNVYTKKPIHVVLAKALITKHFGKGYKKVDHSDLVNNFESTDKEIPYFICGQLLGSELLGMQYEQLLPYCEPYENPENAFQIIPGDFVTTEDGTGIVHTAPTFGADDYMAAKQSNVPGMLVKDEKGNLVPLVTLQGKFRPEVSDFANMYVKNEYYADGDAPEKSVDVQIAIKLKEENKAFRVEKYVHSYPHCWRTDKPVLYYPLDSWFIRVTEKKEALIKLNNTIQWKPTSTGTGRFGKWLENANDWNLSRSRYWGIPIPIWSTKDGTERKCISSIEELKAECQKAVDAGFMDKNPLNKFSVGDMSKENYDAVDLHKHFVDTIVLTSKSGNKMYRESDLIDVWFDSGSMPYAQLHYPFENKDKIESKESFPADFIAEGVDQTRGWFYTLHAIATMVFDSVAYKNVISNGLVLDKNGHKMSKRLGNATDPFDTLSKYGADATRWYMITNAQPWDNLKFDVEGIVEVQRKLFGTLHNTYSFFSLYANIDGFTNEKELIPITERPEIDQWVLSKLNSLIKDVDDLYTSFEPTQAGRLIQDFVNNQLSNWYVRLCRRRFWKSDDAQDKLSAYQTLYTCLKEISIIGSPIAPFYFDQLYCDLTQLSESVHLSDYPTVEESIINIDLEKRMDLAQKICSLSLGLRKKESIKVRQPLEKILIPSLNDEFENSINQIKDLVLSEVNIKDIQLIKDDGEMLVKQIKPNFKSIGPKYGRHMKSISKMVLEFSQKEISEIQKTGVWIGEVDSTEIKLDLNDFEINAKDIPGWVVASEGEITVALDININDALKSEGISREFINRVQNLRKEACLDVTDRININICSNEKVHSAIKTHKIYICNEVLADNLYFVEMDHTKEKISLLNDNDTGISIFTK